MLFRFIFSFLISGLILSNFLGMLFFLAGFGVGFWYPMRGYIQVDGERGRAEQIKAGESGAKQHLRLPPLL